MRWRNCESNGGVFVDCCEDPCLFFKQQTSRGCHDRPAGLSCSRIDESNGSSCSRAPLGSVPK